MKKLILISILGLALSAQATSVLFSDVDVERDLISIKAQFIAFDKYSYNSREDTTVLVESSPDLTAPELAAIIAWGEALGFTVVEIE